MSKQAYVVEKSEKEVNNTILRTIVSMMEARKHLNPKDRKNNIKSICESNNGKNEYTLKLLNNKKLNVKLLKGIFESVNKNSDVKIYADSVKNDNDLSIIVASDLSNTAAVKFNGVYPTIEIFKEDKMMYNILQSPYSPKYEILTKTEKQQVINAYKTDEVHFPVFMINDPVVLFFNAKPGDLFRIIRKSTETGYVSTYRIVGYMRDPELDL